MGVSIGKKTLHVAEGNLFFVDAGDGHNNIFSGRRALSIFELAFVVRGIGALHLCLDDFHWFGDRGEKQVACHT